jgi:mitochondrial fission protein ELM1
MKFTSHPAWLNTFFTEEQISHLKQQQVAYIVSTGGNTLLANALLKQELLKIHAVKNIVSSSLRGMKADYFDVVFTIHPQQQNLAHYLYYPIAPNKMSALQLTKQQARMNLGIQASEQVITVLIGADTKTVGIGLVEEWGAILQKIRTEYPKAKFLLTTSRRTPITFEQALAQYAIQHQIFSSSDQITWVAQSQKCDIKNYILAADWVLSSADSTSMVAEVVMSGQPLLVFFDESKMHDVYIQQQLELLAEKKWLNFYNIAHTQEFKTLLASLKSQHHSNRLAKKLINKLCLHV